MHISQAQWVQINGPYSGDVRALAASGSNVIGSEVAVLASEEFAAGNHSQVWDATRYQSGLYFYRLQAGAYTETKRFVLLR